MFSWISFQSQEKTAQTWQEPLSRRQPSCHAQEKGSEHILPSLPPASG